MQRKRSVASACFLATQLHDFFESVRRRAGVPAPTRSRCSHDAHSEDARATLSDDKGLLLVNNIGQATAHASPLRRESTPHTGLKTLTNQLFEQGA